MRRAKRRWYYWNPIMQQMASVNIDDMDFHKVMEFNAAIKHYRALEKAAREAQK